MSRFPARQQGFTLIEMMITVVISSIVGMTVIGAMTMQQQFYLMHLNTAEAQQNARIALGVITQRLRQAGYGVYVQGMFGEIPVGSCGGDQPLVCNNVDEGSDRVRVVFGTGSMFDDSQTGKHAGQSPNFFVASKAFPEPAGHPLPVGSQVAISGPCTECAADQDHCRNEDLHSQVFTIAEAGAGNNDYYYRYRLEPNPQCSFDDGFSFVAAQSVDFFIDRTDPEHPALMYDADGDGPREPMVLAHDIEDLQLRYGLHLGHTFEGAVDMWCDDPRLAACATGLLTDQENFKRIVAVSVALVARTRYARKRPSTQNMNVFDNMQVHVDGYQRFVYRSTLALRNIVL